MLTFCACTPPLEQVLHLWDFLLAFGVHLNVLCVIAQLFLIRDELLASPRCVYALPSSLTWRSPMKILRTFPPLKARECILLACQFLPDLPTELYDELIRHPLDPEFAGSQR